MKLVYKNSNFYLRKTHDFRLSKTALKQLQDMNLRVGQEIAESHFDVLAASHETAIREEDFELFDKFKKMQSKMEEQEAETESNRQAVGDPMSELTDSIRSLQEKFSGFGVVIEAKIIV